MGRHNELITTGAKRAKKGDTVARPQKGIDAPEIGKVIRVNKDGTLTVRWAVGGLTERVEAKTVVVVWA